MYRTLFVPSFLIALAAPAAAAPAGETCETRATRVVEQLERDAGERLPFRQARLAWQAAKASCEAEVAPVEVAPASAEPEDSAVGRFLAGLLSMEPRNVQKRPGGKYRYIDKD